MVIHRLLPLQVVMCIFIFGGTSRAGDTQVLGKGLRLGGKLVLGHPSNSRLPPGKSRQLILGNWNIDKDCVY